jgi:hypothetical protein
MGRQGAGDPGAAGTWGMRSSPQREPSPVPGRYEPRWLCQACGADFRQWMQLPGEVRRAFLRRRPSSIIELCGKACPGGVRGTGTMLKATPRSINPHHPIDYNAGT